MRKRRPPQAASLDVNLPFQFRTVRMGMQITLLTPLAATATFVLAGYSGSKMRPLGAMFVAIAVAAAVVTTLPWPRLFQSKWGMRVVYGWSAVNVLLITFGIWITGGSRSNLLFLYALTTVFFAISFPPTAQFFLLALTVLSYAVAQPVSGSELLPLVALAILAFLTNFLSRELREQRSAFRRAHLESERRWTLAATVSAAARNMATVDPRGSLGAAVDAIVGLGYRTARIFVGRDQGSRWEVVLPGGAFEECPEGPRCLPSAVHRTVLAEGKALVIQSDERDPECRRALAQFGFRTMVAVPILVQDRTEAVMIVGAADGWDPSLQDVEAFQMLAGQAGVALENAHSFEEQQRTVERMAELDRLKNDFLSTVSHELRTPLTVISGMGLTLERQWSALDDDVRLELLARLNANSQALEAIITRLLDFSRVEAGRLDVRTEDVGVKALVDRLVTRLGALTSGHAVSVEVQPGLSVRADPVLLERVLENLLSNAVKYTPMGSHIRISGQAEEEQAVLTVGDDGPGIPEEELPHLGERFFRGGDPQTRTTRGTGLGLSLVSEILRLHGSQLVIASRVGEGATFSFRLPVVAPPAANRRTGHLPGPGEAEAMGGAPALVPGSGWEEEVLRGERFETVLTAAQMGTEWAVAALYQEFNPRILRYLKALGVDRPREVATHVWADLASNLARFGGDLRSLRRWVFTVARRKRLESNPRGSASNEPVALEDMPSEAAPMVEQEESSPTSQTEESLARISMLPEDQAEVVLLRVVGELTASEVAEIVGSRPAIVRTLERDGLERLRAGALAFVEGGGPEGS